MKIISTIIIILVIIAVGFGTYWYFTKDESGGGPLSGVSIGDFFPFGKAPENEVNTPSTETGTDNETEIENGSNSVAVLPKLFKISSGEHAGATIFASSTETLVRYVDRQTGNVFEYNLSKPEQGNTRITNTTIPKIYSVVWFEKGESMILEYIDERTDTPQAVYATISPNKASTSEISYRELQTSFLSDSAILTPSPSLQNIAYIESFTGSAKVITASKSGASSKEIVSLPTSEWHISWPAENTIVATTKASESVPGYAYAINTSTGALEKIIGNKNGLAVVPNKNPDTILYSFIMNRAPSVYVFTQSTGENQNSRFQTLAEKCSWGNDTVFYCGVPKTLPNKKYPDAWYMGAVSFDDRLWSYDTVSGLTKQLFDPAQITNIDLDIIDIKTDPSESYLIFTNKKDSSLWVYTLSPKT